MARIAGVDIPKDKKIEFALRYIYGIGPTLSKKILTEANVDPDKRTKFLTEEEISRINAIISANYQVEGELRREIQQNIRRLIEIKSYRGLRHLRNLPVRGQRTRTNARTRRGKRKTVGSVKPGAKALKKTQQTK